MIAASTAPARSAAKRSAELPTAERGYAGRIDAELFQSDAAGKVIRSANAGNADFFSVQVGGATDRLTRNECIVEAIHWDGDGDNTLTGSSCCDRAGRRTHTKVNYVSLHVTK